jgi:hypothetical protein
MKRQVWILALLLSAVPAFGQVQDQEEAALRELGMGGIYASGNLALHNIEGESTPVQQLRSFFTSSGLPLSIDQERELQTVVERQQAAIEVSDHSPVAVRRVNIDHMRRIMSVLNPEQQLAWKNYRNEQIKSRGGFPALRLILDEAGTRLTPDQERQVQALYAALNQRVGKLTLESNGRPDLARLSAMENDQLIKVVQLLNADQRKALTASHRTLLTSKIKSRR